MSKLSFILFLFTILLNCKKAEKITISGSETMHSMILQVANEYQKENRNITIDVKGGGSGEGIQELISGLTDFAISSRELTEAEFEKLNKGNQLESVLIAYDGAAFVVHPSNPISEITLDEASDIFSGKIKNWKELKGNNSSIEVVIRDNYSGTREFIREQVVKKLNLGPNEYLENKSREYTDKAKVAINNEEITDLVFKNQNSISYMGMGIANIKSNLKLLKYAKTKKDEFVIPNVQNIKDRKYKLSRGLKMFYKTNKNSKKLDEFVSFVLSEKGQSVILNSGYLRSTLPEVKVEEKRK